MDRLAAAAAAGGVHARTSVVEGDAVDLLDTVAGLELGGGLVVGRGRRGVGSVTHKLLRTTWLPVFVAAGHGGLPGLG